MEDNFPLWVDIVFISIDSKGMHLWFPKVGQARPYKYIACYCSANGIQCLNFLLSSYIKICVDQEMEKNIIKQTINK